MRTWLTTLLICCGVIIPVTVNAQEPMIVHEWGTFTSLQDENGTTIDRINNDDEPVPAFVHRIRENLIYTNLEQATEHPIHGLCAPCSKCVVPCLSGVTMRLETPVVYFYPSASTPAAPFDLHVKFRGGWITEYYPDGLSVAPGLDQHSLQYNTEGSLQWKALALGANFRGPETKDLVWLAPRDVAATPVRATNGESESYLFYRGVANLEAPIRVQISESKSTLSLHSNLRPELRNSEPLLIPAAWDVEILPDRTLAYHPIPSFAIASIAADRSGTTSAAVPVTFPPGAHKAENLDHLRNDMHLALVRDGLFSDEATAMLRTWEKSYFQSPGRRIFYLVPRAWTDYYLPLEISVPHDLTRVMVGRLELVTPNQKELLSRLKEGKYQTKEERIAAFEKLGRFRVALLLNEIKNTSSEILQDLEAELANAEKPTTRLSTAQE